MTVVQLALRSLRTLAGPKLLRHGSYQQLRQLNFSWDVSVNIMDFCMLIDMH